MSFIEFLVFIITMVLLTILSSKKAKAERLRREQNPVEELDEEQERQEAMKEFMRALNIDVDQPKEVPKKKKKKAPPLAPVQEVKIEEPALAPLSTSRKRRNIFKSESIKDAIVIKEILGKPKGLE